MQRVRRDASRVRCFRRVLDICLRGICADDEVWISTGPSLAPTWASVYCCMVGGLSRERSIGRERSAFACGSCQVAVGCLEM